MVYQSNTDAVEKKRPALSHAIRTMPRWKWRLLGIGLVIGTIGLVGQGAAYLSSRNARSAPTNQQPAGSTGVATPSAAPGAPAGASGFVGGQPTAPAPGTAGTPGSPTPDASGDSSATPGMTQVMTPFMTRVGFSLFVGIVVGLVFRTFIRLALTLSVLTIGAAAALSYFHVVNVDLTAVRTETAQATGWLADQGYRLKDMLFNALPSSTSAGIGFLLGFKRR
jgi:uncharacterized membrane protein (Fun14 family)